VLIVHRFLEGMLTNYRAIQPTPSVQVVVDMDGFGAPHVKADKYQTYVRDQAIQYGGVKLFYKHDAPLWSPAEVLRLDPAPDVVIYQ
jgi:ribosomal protein S2